MSERLALCLNSSFLGFYAHAGFLQALHELGIRPAAVSGASAGALVAGLYAAGLPPAEIIDLILAGDLRRAFFEPGSAWRIPATLANLRGHTGAISGWRALDLLKERIGDKRIEECTQPRLALSVTNLAAVRSEIVTAGPLAEFILASGAVPGMFAARAIGEGLFWDGGIANSVPFDPWIEDAQIDTILIHNVTTRVELDARSGTRRMNMSDGFNLSHQIICDELVRLKSELARRAGKRLIVIETLAPRPRVWNAHKLGKSCVEAGRATVAQYHESLAKLR